MTPLVRAYQHGPKARRANVANLRGRSDERRARKCHCCVQLRQRRRYASGEARTTGASKDLLDPRNRARNRQGGAESHGNKTDRDVLGVLPACADTILIELIEHGAVAQAATECLPESIAAHWRDNPLEQPQQLPRGEPTALE